MENLLNVWTHHGRKPTFSEMSKSPSVIGPKTYQGHYGSWRKALEAFVARMNSENGEGDLEKVAAEVSKSIKTVEKAESRKISPEESRSIGLGLRYKVYSGVIWPIRRQLYASTKRPATYLCNRLLTKV